MGTNNKYYVVWQGFAPGVYDSWEEAEMQVSGYPDASYRSFKSLEAAVEAFREGFDKEGLIKEVAREMSRLEKEGTVIEFDKEKAGKADITQPKDPTPISAPTNPTPPVKKRIIIEQPPPYMIDSLAVDAACSGNPGPMEYRGVYVRTGQEIFRVGPLEGGTNNIGEFLAIVHGLALQEKQGTRLPIYSDSVNAQKWVRLGICKTQIEETEQNAKIFDLIRRAETWLRTHTFRLPIYKWETSQWGEIPADFGRKK
ncbi:MAG: ribonuclease H family protein [Bacteroidales bacterium]|nr:ribonuclease H family protein [Bacteroidales bacterium]